MDIFKNLTDQMHELYESLKESGFNDTQAFELTKTYCSVAFANQAIEARDKYYNRKPYSDVRRRMKDYVKKTEETENA